MSLQFVWYSCIHLRKLREIMKLYEGSKIMHPTAGNLRSPQGNPHPPTPLQQTPWSDSTLYLLHFRHRADNLPSEWPAMNSQKLIPLFALGCDGDICHINRCRILAINTMTITTTDYWTQIMVKKPLQYFSLGMDSPGVQDLPLVLLCYRKQRMISSNHLNNTVPTSASHKHCQLIGI